MTHPIEQTDRDAAADNLLRRIILDHGGEMPWMHRNVLHIRQGRGDDHPEVQAFAAHRIAERERRIMDGESNK